MGSFEKLNLTILFLQSMEEKQSSNTIPKMTSKFTISSSNNSRLVTIFGNIRGQFLYIFFSMTNSPTGVVNMKCSFRTSGKISNFLDIKGVTKYNVSPGSIIAYISIDNTCNIPDTTSGELFCSPL